MRESAGWRRELAAPFVPCLFVHRGCSVPGVSRDDAFSGRFPHRYAALRISKEINDLFGDFQRVFVKVEQESGRLIFDEFGVPRNVASDHRKTRGKRLKHDIRHPFIARKIDKQESSPVSGCDFGPREPTFERDCVIQPHLPRKLFEMQTFRSIAYDACNCRKNKSRPDNFQNTQQRLNIFLPMEAAHKQKCQWQMLLIPGWREKCRIDAIRDDANGDGIGSFRKLFQTDRRGDDFVRVA
jgi:hypothetical protein